LRYLCIAFRFVSVVDIPVFGIVTKSPITKNHFIVVATEIQKKLYLRFGISDRQLKEIVVYEFSEV